MKYCPKIIFENSNDIRLIFKRSDWPDSLSLDLFKVCGRIKPDGDRTKYFGPELNCKRQDKYSGNLSQEYGKENAAKEDNTK